LRRCNTRRRAVFLPMPGSLANSATAFSRSEEENCIVQRYRNEGIRHKFQTALEPCTLYLVSCAFTELYQTHYSNWALQKFWGGI
jgi:hypothetical protein